MATPNEFDPAALEQLRALQGPEDPHLVVELINSFLAGTPTALDRLDAQVGGGEAKGTEQEAHRLRGLCGALGLVAMARLCAELEEGARGGALDGAPERMAALRTTFESARRWLEAERAKEGAPPSP